MNMRNTPELNFIADPSIAYGVMMSKRLEAFETDEAVADAVNSREEEVGSEE